MSAGFIIQGSELLFAAITPEQLLVRFGSRRKQLYELKTSLGFVSDRMKVSIFVPIGFVSDFASVPRGLRSIVDNDDPGVVMPSIVHDYLYRNSGKVPEGPFSRKEADDLMLEGMEVCGLPTTQRRAVYFAIRTGGAFTWKN